MLHKHVLVLKFGLLAGLEKRDLLCSSQLNQEILRAVNVVTSGHNTSNSSSRRLNRTDIGLIGLILVEEIWCFGDLVQLWCSPFHSISFHFIPFHSISMQLGYQRTSTVKDSPTSSRCFSSCWASADSVPPNQDLPPSLGSCRSPVKDAAVPMPRHQRSACATSLVLWVRVIHADNMVRTSHNFVQLPYQWHKPTTLLHTALTCSDLSNRIATVVA